MQEEALDALCTKLLPLVELVTPNIPEAQVLSGMALEEAVRAAKAYLSGALGAMLDIGRGRGPMNPLFDLQSAFIDEKQS